MNNEILAKIIEEDVQPIVSKLKTKPLNNSVIVITGASGLVGTYFLATLSQIRKQKHDNFKVVAVVQSTPPPFLKSFIHTRDQIIQCDLADYKSVESLPMADLIIHAAGYAQPGKFLKDPLKTILLNTTATSQLIQKLNKGGRFLFISSSEVYSGLASPPFTEDQIGTTDPQHIRSCYIEGKRGGEAVCAALSSTNNHIVAARLSLAYGPGTKKGDQRAINTFIEQSIAKEHINLLDSGTAKRTYCYVVDAVEILLNIALSGTKPVYNVGGESRVSIKALAKMIGNYTGVRVSVPKLSQKLQGSPNDVFVSMKRYEKEFGKKKYVSFKEGLKRTIAWQKELYREKILVTGADGLVGNAIRQLNPENTFYASRRDADLTKFGEVEKLFKRVKPTQIIHLAAEVGGIGGNLMHSGEYFRNNVLINVNVLECARLSGVKKLISFMSTCVFPDKTAYPLNEKNIHNGPPHPSNFGYAYAKRMLDIQSSSYRKEWGCNYIIAIPTNIYGPHDNWSLQEGHVIPSLIHKIYLAKKEKKPLSVWGTGKPLREFIFSTDIARLSLWALKEYNEDAPIIFSSGKEISIKKLVTTLAKIMDYKEKIIFDSTKPDGQFRKPSDTTKLRRYFPHLALTPLEKGLKITVDWFIKNYPKVRSYDR